jgi:hypothetical protein
MLRFGCSIVLLSLCSAAISQTAISDEALLTKTRALYDAPFSRGLVSFDCAVGLDWKGHFLEVLNTIPPAAVPTIERLQAIQHRVFVDHSGTTVSSIPKAPELDGVPKAAELEHAFNGMIPGALNAWMPFSTNVILPVGSTKYNFEKIDSGYKLVTNGAGVAGTLLLAEDLRITSGVIQLPQPMRFTTEFINGPHGFLMKSVKTGDTSDASAGGVADFSYTYQDVEGFQIPSIVRVKPSTSEAWSYELTDCKVKKGIVIEIGLPKTSP